MKKKMKDLTEDEMERICESQKDCHECPFSDLDCIYMRNLPEDEVEVPEQ